MTNAGTRPASVPVSDGSESARIAGPAGTPQTPSRVDEPGHRPQDASSVSRADGSAPGLATTGAPAPEFDYKAALDLDPWEPGINGCLGCMRCKAGDHATCHGCECACGWRWHPSYYGEGFQSPCPDICRNRGVPDA